MTTTVGTKAACRTGQRILLHRKSLRWGAFVWKLNLQWITESIQLHKEYPSDLQLSLNPKPKTHCSSSTSRSCRCSQGCPAKPGAASGTSGEVARLDTGWTWRNWAPPTAWSKEETQRQMVTGCWSRSLRIGGVIWWLCIILQSQSCTWFVWFHTCMLLAMYNKDRRSLVSPTETIWGFVFEEQSEARREEGSWEKNAKQLGWRRAFSTCSTATVATVESLRTKHELIVSWAQFCGKRQTRGDIRLMRESGETKCHCNCRPCSIPVRLCSSTKSESSNPTEPFLEHPDLGPPGLWFVARPSCLRVLLLRIGHSSCAKAGEVL